MFELDEQQREKLNAWIGAKASKKAYTGACGGRYTYSFTPTSLGLVAKVYDEIDKDTIDLTEYGDW